MNDLYENMKLEIFQTFPSQKTHAINPLTNVPFCPTMRRNDLKDFVSGKKKLHKTGFAEADSEEIDCIACKILIDHFRVDHERFIVPVKIEEYAYDMFFKTGVFNGKTDQKLMNKVFNTLFRTWEFHDFKDQTRDEEKTAAAAAKGDK